MKFIAAMEVNSEDIADNLTQSQALHLIKEIDRAQADWDFTVSVIKYLVDDLREWHATDEEFDLLKILEGA